MISRQKLKLIKSLQLKKYQKQEQKFLVEGEKSVLEILDSRYKINTLLATKRFLRSYQYLFQEKYFEVVEAGVDELTRAGTLKTSNHAIAVVEIPETEDRDLSAIPILPVFESLQDPGNLGTILRTCDWYGLDTIVLSNDSVDVYNPKVIQASMGSFIRVSVVYRDLEEFLSQTDVPIYGTKTRGEIIYKITWPRKLIILFGNESRGIPERLDPFISKVISIPKSGEAESLNVGIATAVILDNLQRKSF
jgi:TrmH family RNA methyltransferase